MKVIDRLYRHALRAMARQDARRRWRRGADHSTLRIDYGCRDIPEATEIVSGGFVKVQDLAQRFPSAREQPNLLYLVSSALPLDADIQIRAARAAGGLVVLNQNGVAYPGWYGEGYERENQPLRYAHAQADYVIYQSKFCKESALQYLGEREPDTSTILHNPVDTTVFTPAETPPEGGPVILLAGTHQFRYRVESSIHCLAQLLPRFPDARLMIAGKHTWTSATDTVERLQDLAASLSLSEHIEWRPPYTQHHAPALMREAHLLLHPKYNDPCPRLAVEAMACGLPVVYSATGGMPELVGPDAGIGVPGPHDYLEDHPPSASDLAEAVTVAWEQLGLMRTAARQRATSALDLALWLDRHADRFETLLRRGGSS